jgi:hypothetical protein
MNKDKTAWDLNRKQNEPDKRITTEFRREDSSYDVRVAHSRHAVRHNIRYYL